jgi:hypothetical protein
MHVTKNVFDNIIGTFLDMPRKTKDGLKSHTDLDGKHFLPPTSYTLTVEEKKTFCQCLRGV